MTSSLDMIRGRSNIVTLTNNSGGALVAGDVVIQDTSADENVTTTTSAASVLKVFVAAESIAIAAAGRFYESGYCPLVNVNASVTRGRFLFTHTVAKQAAENATYGAGAFGKILKSGATPSAIIYSATGQVGSSGVTRSGSTTDAHLAVWNGSNADSLKDGGAVGSGGANTADPFVIGQGTAADLSAKIQIPSLSASPDIAGGPPTGGLDYEFDSATDPFTWSANPTHFDANTTFKSHYYLDDNSTTTKFGLINWSPAGAFDARLRGVFGADHAKTAAFSVSLWIGSSDNNTAAVLTFEGVNSVSYFQSVGAYTVSGGSFTQRGASHSLLLEAYLRITRDGSNNISFYWSTNGLLWRLIATQAHTISVAKIGLRINSVSAVSLYAAIDWLRTNV